ncbi:hypothetical protein KTQ42_13100|uniref:hypothetical protein n=1 Tax=Noviherbaspirillum sp. L7-7A TaxID=2850560 RepID=UPI001C2C3C25|nr:hypothetical protein [Noviherbaspirillum sp. L7-7A]MBV0880241.1 hypothetical protein [Noviherbaspirillum sp. L7-7A]
MFSCFIDLGLPTMFNGYDLLDYSSTRSAVPATRECESETVVPSAVVLNPAEPRANQSNGFLKSIKSFFAFCFSGWLTSAEPRAAAANEAENADGQGKPGNCASQGNEDDSLKAPEGVESHRPPPNIITLPFDSDDEDYLSEKRNDERIRNLIDTLSNSASENDKDYLSEERNDEGKNALIGAPSNSASGNDDDYSDGYDREFWKHFNNGESIDPDDYDSSCSDSEDENSLAH